MHSVRVRFAPSPTGPLHIGGLRTALYNYLFARKQGGRFIVRIEDTDQNRLVPGAEAYLFEALKWCGIEVDESPLAGGPFGPYRQSERKQLYRGYAQELIARGQAYYAFDSQEELAALRKVSEAEGSVFRYNARNRKQLKNSLSLEAEATERYLKDQAYVIRFKTPEDRTIVTRDRIRGQSEIQSALLDDKILYKSDGMPTYHLANVIDDHAMRISHVIRGEEWLPSLALHQLLYEAFGWEQPEFAHLPLILKPFGQGKLSKRDGDKHGFPIFPLAWCDPKTGARTAGYKERGYLPEALVNTLALLGWNPGTERECFSMAELERAFSLERINKAGAKFNPDKAVWFNHHHLQARSSRTLARELDAILKAKHIEKTLAFTERVVSLSRERVDFVADIFEQAQYFFTRPERYEERAARKVFGTEARPVLIALKKSFEKATDFSAEGLEQETKALMTSEGIPLGQGMRALRLSLVGALQGPAVFEIAALLGQAECVARLETALRFVERH